MCEVELFHKSFHDHSWPYVWSCLLTWASWHAWSWDGIQPGSPDERPCPAAPAALCSYHSALPQSPAAPCSTYSAPRHSPHHPQSPSPPLQQLPESSHNIHKATFSSCFAATGVRIGHTKQQWYQHLDLALPESLTVFPALRTRHCSHTEAPQIQM